MSHSLNFVTSIFSKPSSLSPTLRRNRPSTPNRIPICSLSSESLGVIITGSTKGVGRALAEEFAKRSDRIVISSRTSEAVAVTVSSLRARYPSAQVFGCVADVCKHDDVKHLTEFAAQNLGVVDTMICNAGTTGKRGPVKEADETDLETCVKTNMLGSIFCAKHAQGVAVRQEKALHVFLMDGSGTMGNATAGYAAYGATKRCVPQLIKSLTIEAKGGNIRFHQLSPGMVLTDLLLSGNVEPRVRQFFNFLADEPETVAEELVPQIRDAVIGDKRGTYIAYLTIPKAVFRLATGFLLGMRRGKFFDPNTGLRTDKSGNFNANGVRVKD